MLARLILACLLQIQYCQGKPFKDLPTLEQVVNKTYTAGQVKSLHQLFHAHGMDLLGPPLGFE